MQDRSNRHQRCLTVGVHLIGSTMIWGGHNWSAVRAPTGHPPAGWLGRTAFLFWALRHVCGAGVPPALLRPNLSGSRDGRTTIISRLGGEPLFGVGRGHDVGHHAPMVVVVAAFLFWSLSCRGFPAPGMMKIIAYGGPDVVYWSSRRRDERRYPRYGEGDFVRFPTSIFGAVRRFIAAFLLPPTRTQGTGCPTGSSAFHIFPQVGIRVFSR